MRTPIYQSSSTESKRNAHNTNDRIERYELRQPTNEDKCRANQQWAQARFKNLNWLNERK